MSTTTQSRQEVIDALAAIEPTGSTFNGMTDAVHAGSFHNSFEAATVFVEGLAAIYLAEGFPPHTAKVMIAQRVRDYVNAVTESV